MQCELYQQFENLLKADFEQMVSRHDGLIHKSRYIAISL
jgi:hypothetical protein